MRIIKLPLYKKLPRYVLSRIFASNAGNTNAAENGETWLIAQLVNGWAKIKETPVIFDVGANRGEYSALAETACRSSEISFSLHAFEPMPHSAALFRERFTSLPSVTLSEAALAETRGEAPVYFTEDDSTFASLHKRELLNPLKQQVIQTIRGDTYVADKRIPKIHLLKVDTEGHEISVLKGFGDFLQAKTIDCIQFEYGGATLDAHGTLRELFLLLESRGFVIARLMPTYLEVQHYHPLLEDFEYRNYVALGSELQARL